MQHSRICSFRRCLHSLSNDLQIDLITADRLCVPLWQYRKAVRRVPITNGPWFKPMSKLKSRVKAKKCYTCRIPPAVPAVKSFMVFVVEFFSAIVAACGGRRGRRRCAEPKVCCHTGRRWDSRLESDSESKIKISNTSFWLPNPAIILNNPWSGTNGI